MNPLDESTLLTLLKTGIIDDNTYQSLTNSKKDQFSDITLKHIYSNFIIMLKEKHKKNTLDGYTTNVKKFWEDYFSQDFSEIPDTQKIPIINKKNINDWFEKLAAQGYTYQSIRRYKHSIRKFFDFAKEQFQIDVPDISDVEIPIEDDEKSDNWMDALRDDEVRAIANCSKTIRDKCLILFMYETGMKRGELINCKTSDIDFNDNTVNIYTEDGKLDRVGCFSDEVKKLINEHIDEFDALVWNINNTRKMKNISPVVISEYLFQTTRDNPKISPSTIFKAIKDAAYEYYLSKYNNDTEKAKSMVKKIYPETLRNSKRAWLFSEGKTLEQVQATMGDENKWVCRRYLKIAQQLYPRKF